jgi:signal transduction histidine kinase
MLEQYGLLLDETGKDYLQRIIRSAAHLNQLVTDLLAYARLGREKIEFTQIDLGRLIAGLISDHTNEFRNRDAKVTKQRSFPAVRGHELTLRLALENLLSNAIKFVAPGIKPQINISAERRGETVRIFVTDNGIGIAPEHQTQIFGVFHRLHTKAYPGTGIGLALVDKAIQRMGGKVGVESEIGKGSRFWIDLPCAE